ncbi:DEAD/DEAH box helicase family protein [Bacillus cereus group sp. BfR-BA-01355]|uniref:DEAD/DEAH box helicase n=1 Tax=Bacillus cereus group sp. BfR-BA-01355 TaxID=2920318 RepID=UPI001F575E0E|nr:DEAD/DEAH box helicase family protein [Bacillus cereus group sp. BfR-BA-01355]
MNFNINYFVKPVAQPNILENECLRNAQVNAYVEISKHFLLEKSKEHAVVVLPTGAGKTGVMAISPFGLSKGRVLIITPQLVIKDHVVDSLDPSEINNFWLKHKIFDKFEHLPKVVEYDKDTHDEELENSNIVILNIHKLSPQYKKSLLNKVDKNFFDMIIVDEAHHSPAKTWQQALDYFNEAKVLKVTGTPFRADRKEIHGKMIVNYRLGQAMHDGIVKSLKNFVLQPEKIMLTIDDDPSQTYTLDQLREEGIKESDYITRSVALSDVCNQHIIESSIEHLKQKKSESDVPHKIIAVCCSIEHAQRVKALYEKTGLRSVIVHSDLKKQNKETALRMIESHQTDVVIHVAMLGEGYDHPYLSIAAIFRPYRSLAPYSQFIGRILRRIPETETKSESDNIGVVIAHEELGLQELWEEYKQEQDYASLLSSVSGSEKQERKLEREIKKQDKDVGKVTAEGEIYFSEDFYEYTLAAQKYEEYEQNLQNEIAKLKEQLPHITDEELRRLVNKGNVEHEFNPLINNPKKFRIKLREEFNQRIQFDLPATLLLDYGLEAQGNELTQLPIKQKWILQKEKNDAIISVFLNNACKQRFGERSEWAIDDYKHADAYLEQIIVQLRKMLESII